MQDSAWFDKVASVKTVFPNLTYDDDNWISGTLGKFKFIAKVYSEPSEFGIKNGHISKLQVCDSSKPRWGLSANCFVNYDRGWDVRPKDTPEREFLNKLLESFGDSPLEDDDYLYYELRGYKTEEDFEDRNFEYLGALDTKADAISEANGYVVGSEHWESFAVVKVLCSDPEADDDVIIRAEVTEKSS